MSRGPGVGGGIGVLMWLRDIAHVEIEASRAVREFGRRGGIAVDGWTDVCGGHPGTFPRHIG